GEGIARGNGQEALRVIVENTVLILFVVGLLLSFFLSGMESGVFALSRLRIRHYVRQGQRRARVLHEYLEKPESFLWTILIGNTLAAVAVVSIGVRWLHQWLAPNWLLLTLSLAAGVLIFYGAFELLPKRGVLVLLCCVRVAAEDAFSPFPKPPLSGPGVAVPGGLRRVAPAGHAAGHYLPVALLLSRRTTGS